MTKVSLFICCLSFSLIFSQNERDISGVVIDKATNQPLLGASILIKGTSRGATTDLDGKFKYTIRTTQSVASVVLVVSYVGFKTQNITVGDKSYFEIFLEEGTQALGEVVITTSYGTEKLKEEVVGSISTLSSDDVITEQSFESFEQLIEGQVPGLLLNASTEIGTPTAINIRGQGSLTPLNNQFGTSTQPLFIVDGVVLIEDRGFGDDLFDGDGTFGSTFLNPLARIPANEIASISVLKDAAAVGIYGADAANGVIIITTKKGRQGKPKFNINFTSGISEGINRIKYLDGQQYSELYNTYLLNSNQSPIPFNGNNVDWFDVLNKSGSFSRFNAAVNGSVKQVNYRIGFNYLHTDEAQLANEFTTWGASANIGLRLDQFSVNLSANYSNNNRTAPNDYFNFILAPTFPIYDEDGAFSETGTNGIPNPLAAIEQNIDESKINSLITSLNLKYDISESLSVSSIFGIDYSDKDETLWLSGANESGRRSGTFKTELNGELFPNWGRSLLRDKEQTKWNWSSQLFYNKDFNDHHLDALLGLELRSDKSTNTRELGTGYTNPNFYQTPLEAQRLDIETVNGQDVIILDENGNPELEGYNFDRLISEQNGRSFFAQVNYDYKKKYYFLANIRRDESSAFGSDKNVAWNGGLGASWVLSNETFLSDVDYLNFLRLRVSWGIVGNSRIGSFRSSGLYQIIENDFNELDSATPVNSAPPNNELGWEINEKFNVGLDVNLFNALNITMDYFRDNRRDMIVSRDVPLETGYTTAEINGASMVNQGLELGIQTEINRDNFKWSSNFTLATLKNEITELTGLGDDFSNGERAVAQRIGSSTSTIWGYRWIGIDPATGRNLYNINGQIIDGTVLNDLTDNTDWEALGDRNPEVYGGWSNQFQFFKRFSFSFLINYKWGQDILLDDELINKYSNLDNRNLSVNALDYWTQQGDITINPIPIDNLNRLNNTSRYVFDETYIKLQSVSLGYNVPVKGFNTCNIIINATNLAYWFRQGNRPGRNGVRELRLAYPEMRTITLGMNLSF